MVRDGSWHGESPTTFAGTPATVTLFGTSLSTTDPAAMRAQRPTAMLPMMLALAPISTPSRIFGWHRRDPCRAAERHAVEHRHIVADRRGLANDEAGGMVEEDAAADLGRRMDVALKHRRRPALQVVGEVLAALVPEPVRQPDASEWRGSPCSRARLMKRSVAGSRSNTATMSARNASPICGWSSSASA